MNKKLYVGNLSFETGDAQLEELFGKAGKVERVRVMRDMVTGRGRGFAFVEMASQQDAQNAVSMFNQYSLHGRSLTVNEARPQVERKNGGYRPGGRGRWCMGNNGRTGLEPAPCFTAPITAGQKFHNFRRAEAVPKSGGSHESQGQCPQC